MPDTQDPDVLILGAGGAGLMCAIHAARRGKKVLVLDHASKIGGKILISGGGRCNFTNLGASPTQYVSKNPHFCTSAFSRFRPADFIQMVESHGIAYHEKKLGQLFCDGSAQQIVDLLKRECDEAGAAIRLGCRIEQVEQAGPGADGRFLVRTSLGAFQTTSLVVATGGLSIPKIGATGLGYQIAQQFGLGIIETAPALDGFTFSAEITRELSQLAGVSIDCRLTSGSQSFRENILFTHSGLSGPASLQGSLHWRPGERIRIDLLPETPLFEWLMAKKRSGNRSIVRNLLAELLPSRFAEWFCGRHFQSTLPLPQVSEKELQVFCSRIHGWELEPSGTVGYSKAEVTRGGVDTQELSSKTMEARRVPGLYFIGEVVDVTGWLGGYNFHWAWASGWAAGQSV